MIIKDKMNFDTGLSFADVTPGYWDSYHRKLSDPSVPLVDVELRCPLLPEYQRMLYDGRRYVGSDGKEHEFHLDKDMSGNGLKFSSDSITVSYRFFSRCSDLVGEAKAKIGNYEPMIEDFVKYTYTIGGEIIFPAQGRSLNQARGQHPSIGDRMDLTLRSIRDWYDRKDPDSYALSYVLSLEPQVKFLSMFRDFEEFCRFFFLDDLLDNGDIRLFCPLKGKSPFPKDIVNYVQLLMNQREFVDKRNKRMEEYIRSKQ